MKIKKTEQVPADESIVLWVSGPDQIHHTPLTQTEQDHLKKYYKKDIKDTFFFNRLSQWVCVYVCEELPENQLLEKLRRKGDDFVGFLQKEQQSQAVIFAEHIPALPALALAEGMALGAYRFVKHKPKEREKNGFSLVKVLSDKVASSELVRLENLVKACFEARNLVNEPANVLDALRFAEHMQSACRQAGAQVEVFDKEKIRSLGMEALLAVNKGSQTEPSFTVIEWKPDTATQEAPVVLVGKGLVFDTGGISLKPSRGMDAMKSDMAGGAAVFGAMYALALNKIPVHVVGLIPATDNRPGENAMLPGDIITLSNGKTVEILNTDAEGRLILADALLYAQQYKPRLVINIATLTGTASVAIGKHGMVGMHQNAQEHMEQLKQCGERVYERIAEMPFWEEYGEEVVSDVADLRNIGKASGGGAITAGKFLAHFTSYPWVHLDIAGVAYMEGRESYRGKGATAMGVRLLYDYIRSHCT